MEALARIDGWHAGYAAAGIVGRSGVVATHGPPVHVFRWASVTKLLTAYAALIAAEEGVLDLDAAAGPSNSTVRHLLAHASGLPFEGWDLLGRPGERRVYSNTGFDVVGAVLAEQAGMPFTTYVEAAVLEPLGMRGTTIDPDEPRGAPAAGAYGPLVDLLTFARELLEPRLVAAETLSEATTVAFPGLGGVLPGFGRFEPMDWGLGFELRDGKRPHWTGARASPATFGHFGGSGTFLWVDPVRAVALGCLTDREFGAWALTAWPELSDAVLDGLSGR